MLPAKFFNDIKNVDAGGVQSPGAHLYYRPVDEEGVPRFETQNHLARHSSSRAIPTQSKSIRTSTYGVVKISLARQ